MKLFLRVYGALLGVVLLTLLADGYLNFNREIEQFETEMRNDAILWGNNIAKLINLIRQSGSDEQVISLLRQVNSDSGPTTINWHNREQMGQVLAALPPGSLSHQAADNGEAFSVKRPDRRFARDLITYVPLKTGSNERGYLELVEPFEPVTTYTKNSLIWSIAIGFILLTVSGSTLWLFFNKLIRIPVERLTQQAERIGAGDLSPAVVPERNDELSELVDQMNKMAQSIEEAKGRTEEESKARLEALNQLRHSERLATVGRLAAGLAHELGTPLNVVAGRAKLIEAEELDEEEKLSSARIIREQVQRITTIMRQLLDFARRRQGVRVATDLAQLIEQVMEVIAPIAKKNSVTLVVDCQQKCPKIPIDTSHIQQLLFNLITNGIHSMAEGGDLTISCFEMPTADLEKYGDGHELLEPMVALTVQDTGAGIEKAALEGLFEPFFTTKKVGEGTGLGLSIVEGIVQEHGGKIFVESELGQGTTFTVLLPMRSGGE